MSPSQTFTSPNRDSQILVFADPDALTRRIADDILRLAQDVSARNPIFRLLLSGGHTPHDLYRLLATEPYLGAMPWPRMELLLSDERCVPFGHPDSNFGMLQRLLLDHLPVDPRLQFYMDGSIHPSTAAIHFAQAFQALTGEARPAIDLALLGLGADGHTAALYPSTAPLAHVERLALPTEAPTPPHARVSVTPWLLDRAQEAWFLVIGADRAEALARTWAAVSEGRRDPALPVTWFHPLAGLRFYADEAASAALEANPRRGLRPQPMG